MFKKLQYWTGCLLLCLLFLFVLSEGTALAGGITIEPGQILIQNVPPDTSYDIFENTGVKLKLINHDTTANTYSIFSTKPSKVSTGTWLKGYLEIPDAKWFYFDKNKVTIGPNDTAYVNMYLKIPAEEKYCNQHWIVAIPIEGSPGEGGAIGIMLALYPQFLIETESKTLMGERPYGSIGLEPSIVLLENVQLGKTVKAEVTIYNNDQTEHTYRLKATAPELISETKKQEISPSPGYSWIPDPKWVKPNPGKFLGLVSTIKDVKVDAGKSKKFPLKITIPEDDNYYGQKWEVIIMAEPEKGPAGFVRLKIETQEKQVS